MLGTGVLLAALAAPLTPSSACVAPVGRLVMLKSTDLDPDVFVWDSRQRVIEYAAGYWRNTQDVLAHSLLAKPGTRARVVSCATGAVRSKYTSERLDAVGVLLMTGPGRGRYGWVTSEDVHIDTR